MQTLLPIVIGAATEAGLTRAARIADGINPGAYEYDQLVTAVRTFRTAAAANGRDAATLPVYARANVPMTTDPLGDGRPFLGGSPSEIAADVRRLAEHGVDHVFFYNTTPDGLDNQLRLMADLRAQVG